MRNKYQLDAPPAAYEWEGAMPVPVVGQRVRIKSWGTTGTVQAYFIEDGLLGVHVTPDDPPAWWLECQRRMGKDGRMAYFLGFDLLPYESTSTPTNPIATTANTYRRKPPRMAGIAASIIALFGRA